MGYTPLFDTLTKGTLCGKWPDIGLWPIVLSLADHRGHVDCHFGFIAGVTGLPVEEVEACMKRFCESDHESRTDGSSGARLVLLDDHRNWGWRVVNHEKYREKARLAAKNAREVETGSNMARLADRRRPPETASHTHTQTKQDTPASQGGARAKKASRKTELPDGFALDPPLLAYAQEQLPDADVEKLFANFCDQARMKAWKYANWRLAFQTYCRNCHADSGHWAAGQYPRKGATKWR
jgi:hypothetical protein